jgi:hypothetical protein
LIALHAFITFEVILYATNVCNAINNKFKFMDNGFFILNNFTSKKEFEKLKTYFKQYDVNFYNPVLESKFDKENPKITVQDFICIDEEQGILQELDKELEFVNDFLNPGLSRISENEISNFKNICYSKGLFTKQGREGYALTKKEELVFIKEKINKASYLSNEIRKIINKEIKNIISGLKRYIHNPYPRLNKKLDVNLQRNEIVGLFYLLNKDGKFNNATKSDIGRIIDDNFRYLDKDINRYIDIVGSNKDFVDFDGGSGDKTPFESIKKIFTSKNFYNIK